MSKKIYKTGIIGHFGFGENLLNGQTIKTKIITSELENKYGCDEILKIDTHGGLKAYFKLPFQIIKCLKRCSNVIIFPAHNGIKIIVPLLSFFNHFFHKSLQYCVIGGWLPSFLEGKKGIKKRLQKFDAIYVETTAMENNLKKIGFNNIVKMPNCKRLEIANPNSFSKVVEKPLKLCTFSRVMKEKGIEEACNAVKKINELLGETIYSLDIFGQIDSDQENWFKELQNNFPSFITYKGEVAFDKSVEILKDYFALLFPTNFYTEGIPGTIIDAYAAGVPVISSKWENFADIIDDKETGYCFEFGDFENLVNMLEKIAKNPDMILKLKNNCVEKAKQFNPGVVIEKIVLR